MKIVNVSFCCNILTAKKKIEINVDVIFITDMVLCSDI